MFLQQHTDTGTSLETAEDLLSEHQEFEIRAEVCVCYVLVITVLK